MEIRMAAVQDIRAVCSLYEELYQDMARLQPQYWRKAHANRAFITNIIESDQSDILLAVKNEEIAGFALVQQEKTSPYECIIPHDYALLMDLVVHAPFRGDGIGSALLESVRLWAKNRDLDYIELNVLHENARAYELYLRHGYEPSMHRMRVPLKRPGRKKR